MGVRGLTTFINSNSHMYFVEFNLHGCPLVIDGNSLAAVLYSETISPYSAFGGDYDHFAEHVENLIKNLKKCEIEPIFVFDGGYEQKKATTVRKRNAMKVYAIEKVAPNRPARDFFPLMLRPVLQERLMELDIVCLQSDFEADREIAAIAKRLNAPVLSNDSDFFIFDIAFIPLSTFPFDVCLSSSESIDVYCYIPCQIFYVDNFLKSFGGLQKDMLPLLATVLGNDYLNRSVFKNFYGLIKIDKSKKLTLSQRRVGGLIKWLKNETFDSAFKKILASLPKNHRQRIRNNINSIIIGYSNLSTCLDEYLPCKIRDRQMCDNICSQLKELNITEREESSNEDCSESENNMEGQDENDIDSVENSQKEVSGEEEYSEYDQIISKQPLLAYGNNFKIPQWLLERSRRCQMAPQIITLFTLNSYFCVPQMEDCSLPHAGEVGLPLLRIIGGLLLGTSSVSYWYRFSSSDYRCKLIETLEYFKLGKLPEIFALSEVSTDYRKNILLDAMKVERGEFLEPYPEDWRLLIICLVYWIKSKETVNPCHIHAVILMLIAVNICQTKIGFFRKTKLFVRKYGAKLKSLEKIRANVTAKYVENGNKSIIQQLSEITIDDCLLFFQIILSDFSVDTGLKERPRSFSRTLVHTFAELQTVLDLGQTLNLLLLQPYKRLRISKFYNGTFLYNVAANLKRQSEIINYLEKLFKKSPSLLNLHMTLYTALAQVTSWSITEPKKLRKKRHKKRRDKTAEDSSELEENEEIDSFHDVNNKFSLLQETTKL
uniref:XPG N-terminal domain-containing protein n=1 Tax=Panstrongylus lignarius TaxID=156445 RepID=A0A224XJ26_9HEMI